MRTRAIYPGSFDPFTNGHLDIVSRALTVFDELIIVIAKSDRKSPLLTVDERVHLIGQCVQECGASAKRVKIDSWDGLIMDYARKHRAQALVRGLRAASDFEYEFMMAAMNRELNPDVETFFMMTGQNLYFVSSSMVKELIHFGGDVSSYVPHHMNQYLLKNKKGAPKKGSKKGL